MCENRFCPVLRAGLLSHCCGNSVSYFITGLSHLIEKHEDPIECVTLSWPVWIVLSVFLVDFLTILTSQGFFWRHDHDHPLCLFTSKEAPHLTCSASHWLVYYPGAILPVVVVAKTWVLLTYSTQDDQMSVVVSPIAGWCKQTELRTRFLEP